MKSKANLKSAGESGSPFGTPLWMSTVCDLLMPLSIIISLYYNREAMTLVKLGDIPLGFNIHTWTKLSNVPQTSRKTMALPFIFQFWVFFLRLNR